MGKKKLFFQSRLKKGIYPIAALALRLKYPKWDNAVIVAHNISTLEECWVFFDTDGLISLNSPISLTSETVAGTDTLGSWIGSGNASCRKYYVQRESNIISSFFSIGVDTFNIVINGSVVLNGGLPSLYKNGDQGMSSSNIKDAVNYRSYITTMAVGVQENTNSKGTFMNTGGSANRMSINISTDSTKRVLMSQSAAGILDLQLINRGSANVTRLITGISSPTNAIFKAYQNNILQDEGANTQINIDSRWYLGARNYLLPIIGHIQELLWYRDITEDEMSGINQQLMSDFNIT